MKPSDVSTGNIYYCSRAKTLCCVVGSYWDDDAALIACKYVEDDTTDELFITEASCLTQDRSAH